MKKLNKPIVVLDTNVFLVALAPQSPFSLILDTLLEHLFTLVITNEILLEYEEVISRRYDSLLVKDIFELLLHLPNVIQRDVFFKWNFILNDLDDNKFVDIAIATNADYLVSSDKHFNILKEIPYPKVNLIGIDDFLEICAEMKKI